MGPKTQRRHVNDTVGDVARGKPYHWQAFAASCIFRRRTANDAVVTTDCGLPHHLHAFGDPELIQCTLYKAIVAEALSVY